MKNEGRDIVDEAVNDAKALKEAAMTAAKNELVEQMAPALRALLEKSLRGVLNEDKPNDQNVGYLGAPGRAEKNAKFQENEDKGEKDMPKHKEDELDLESIASFFPPMTEEVPVEDDEPKEGADFGGIPTLGEEPQMPQLEAREESDEEEAPVKEGKKKDDEEKDEMDESIEISEAELKKVYEAALQTEVQVKKGFSDMTKSGELDDVVKDAGKGLNPEKKGEHTWEDGKGSLEAPVDFTVKEGALKKLIAQGLAENKQLRKENSQLRQIANGLAGKLNESNLFATKVLHVNRLLTKHGRLTTEQKKVVLESIDVAKTVDQVRMVYEAISRSFAAATQLSEGKKPVANSQRARTSGTPDQRVLRESVDNQKGQEYDRLMQLAGIVK